MSVAAISCIFGSHFTYVYKAPIESHSYFFTNNKEIQHHLTEMGWNYMYVDVPLGDVLESSLQSTYITFLQFLEKDEYKHVFAPYSYLFYADHKRKIKATHIKEYINLQQQTNKSITICLHERDQRNLQEEINDSLLQEQYSKNQNQNPTLELVETHHTPLDTPICDTGIILYKTQTGSESYHNLLKRVYQSCIHLSQPQSQIMWSIYSNDYHDLIQTIPFYHINVHWREPYSPFIETIIDAVLDNYFIMIIFILLLVLIYKLK
jgi:hypothetical protein